MIASPADAKDISGEAAEVLPGWINDGVLALKGEERKAPTAFRCEKDVFAACKCINGIGIFTNVMLFKCNCGHYLVELIIIYSWRHLAPVAGLVDLRRHKTPSRGNKPRCSSNSVMVIETDYQAYLNTLAKKDRA